MTANRPYWPFGAVALAFALAACTPATKPHANAPVAPYAAVARGRIDVEGGLISLAAAREGTIRRVAVQEGQTVHQGDMLLELDGTTSQLAINAAEAELSQVRSQAELLRGQESAARTRARRLNEAAQAGAGEGQAADDAESAADQLGAQRKVAAAVITAAYVKIASARRELALLTLRAPQDATVARVAAQVGVAVSPQSGPLITLVPQTPRIVRAELSEAYANDVRAGMPATISAEDAPSREWPARVLRVGTVVGPSLLDEDPQRRASAHTVDCVLTLQGPVPLRIGQRVLVRVGTLAPAAKD